MEEKQLPELSIRLVLIELQHRRPDDVAVKSAVERILELLKNGPTTPAEGHSYD